MLPHHPHEDGDDGILLETGYLLPNEKATAVLLSAQRLGVSPDTIFLAAYFKTLLQLHGHNPSNAVFNYLYQNIKKDAGNDRPQYV